MIRQDVYCIFGQAVLSLAKSALILMPGGCGSKRERSLEQNKVPLLDCVEKVCESRLERSIIMFALFFVVCVWDIMGQL